MALICVASSLTDPSNPLRLEVCFEGDTTTVAYSHDEQNVEGTGKVYRFSRPAVCTRHKHGLVNWNLKVSLCVDPPMPTHQLEEAISTQHRSALLRIP